MKRFLGILIVLIACVVAIGFYQGWFAVSSRSPDAESHKVNINLAVDPDKVKADAEAVKKKTAEFTGQATEGVKDVVDQPNDGVKADQ